MSDPSIKEPSRPSPAPSDRRQDTAPRYLRVLRRLSPWPLSQTYTTLTILLSFGVGAAAGLGALVFNWWIWVVREGTRGPIQEGVLNHSSLASWWWLLLFIPSVGMVACAWLTNRFSPEAQGHGVPEVIAAVARKGGRIRPRVASLKLIASGLTIGTGGSAGSEGPIVQIGAATGSVFGQWCRLPERSMKVLVAAGAAAGISATFGAPIAGVMFASEVILGNFAVNSLTPIVIAAVVANLVFVRGFPLVAFVDPERLVDGRVQPLFTEARHFVFNDITTLPLFIFLGIVSGFAAVGFTKFLYATESVLARRFPNWFWRAVVAGLIVGVCAVHPAFYSLYGVGYDCIRETLRMPLEMSVYLLVAFFVLKLLTTSVTLGGGGSGGIFAPSLFLGAVLGALFGMLFDAIFPGLSIKTGTFAVVGMASVVAGATHGPLSAVLILFEMTQDYNLVLPLLCASGLSSVIARAVDPESIYTKKLARRGELTGWGHHTTSLEDIYVRDLMIRNFPTVAEDAPLGEIVKLALQFPHVACLPVTSVEGQLLGVIGSEDLHRVLDSDMQPTLLRACDIVQWTPTTVTPDQNLLDALRDFGEYDDIDGLPVMARGVGGPSLVGVLPRSRVMRRYRQELLRHHPRTKSRDGGSPRRSPG